MSVYVDDMFATFGRMKMCHLIADTPEELHEFAVRLGLQMRWLQNEGTVREHFDVSMEKRALAMRLGAQEVTARELVVLIQRKRVTASLSGTAGLHSSEGT